MPRIHKDNTLELVKQRNTDFGATFSVDPLYGFFVGEVVEFVTKVDISTNIGKIIGFKTLANRLIHRNMTREFCLIKTTNIKFIGAADVPGVITIPFSEIYKLQN